MIERVFDTEIGVAALSSRDATRFVFLADVEGEELPEYPIDFTNTARAGARQWGLVEDHEAEVPKRVTQVARETGPRGFGARD